MTHPCLRCGACCAMHRVVFHWREGEDAQPDGVPLAYCSDWNSTLRCMRGTEGGGRCAALVGAVGQQVSCRIHARRPTVCRAFPASLEDGVTVSERCDQARARFGLPPLSLADWPDDDDRPHSPSAA